MEIFKTKRTLLNIICYLTLMAVSIFDIYYFFIFRDVSPIFYIKKFIGSTVDPILSNPLYRDWLKEFEYLNEISRKKPPIVFVGDSIIARFKVSEYFPERHVLNRGIYSDTIWGLLNRLEINVNNLNAASCFVLIGYNDFKYHRLSEICSLYDLLLNRIRARKVYIISLLPVDRSRSELNTNIKKANREIMLLANRNNIIFIDAFTVFVDADGYMRSDLSTDGVHPNLNGYLLLKRLVEPLLDIQE